MSFPIKQNNWSWVQLWAEHSTLSLLLILLWHRLWVFPHSGLSGFSPCFSTLEITGIREVVSSVKPRWWTINHNHINQWVWTEVFQEEIIKLISAGSGGAASLDPSGSRRSSSPCLPEHQVWVQKWWFQCKFCACLSGLCVCSSFHVNLQELLL